MFYHFRDESIFVQLYYFRECVILRNKPWSIGVSVALINLKSYFTITNYRSTTVWLQTATNLLFRLLESNILVTDSLHVLIKTDSQTVTCDILMAQRCIQFMNSIVSIFAIRLMYYTYKLEHKAFECICILNGVLVNEIPNGFYIFVLKPPCTIFYHHKPIPKQQTQQQQKNVSMRTTVQQKIIWAWFYIYFLQQPTIPPFQQPLLCVFHVSIVRKGQCIKGWALGLFSSIFISCKTQRKFGFPFFLQVFHVLVLLPRRWVVLTFHGGYRWYLFSMYL